MNTEEKKPTPIVKWAGGKRRMLKQLLPLIPEHTCYCEVFAGGMALLMAKPRSTVEVVNDLNGDLIGLYRVVQYHLQAFLEELKFLHGSRQQQRDFVTQPGLTDIQRAARFFVRNRCAFGQNSKTFGVQKVSGGGPGINHQRVAEKFEAANKRMDGVIIENISYEHCLKLYDGPKTFFFMDPPYVGPDMTEYRGWSDAEMVAFKNRIDPLKAKWIATVNDSPSNRVLFKNHKQIQVTTQCCATQSRKRRSFGELIVLSV